MFRRSALLLLLVGPLLRGVIIDRVAIVVGDAIIKDSDIDRDLRVTEFLNAQPLNFTAAARKQAANRLMDQIFIRNEIRVANYGEASMQDAARELNGLIQSRFKSQAAFEGALNRYGLTEPDLRVAFQWQLTVLRFIGARFQPAVLIPDQDVANYYTQHVTALRREHPGKSSLEDLEPDIRNVLTGEQVNKLFFSWLDEQRGDTKIRYMEDSLK